MKNYSDITEGDRSNIFADPKSYESDPIARYLARTWRGWLVLAVLVGAVIYARSVFEDTARAGIESASAAFGRFSEDLEQVDTLKLQLAESSLDPEKASEVAKNLDDVRKRVAAQAKALVDMRDPYRSLVLPLLISKGEASAELAAALPPLALTADKLQPEELAQLVKDGMALQKARQALEAGEPDARQQLMQLTAGTSPYALLAAKSLARMVVLDGAPGLAVGTGSTIQAGSSAASTSTVNTSTVNTASVDPKTAKAEALAAIESLKQRVPEFSPLLEKDLEALR